MALTWSFCMLDAEGRVIDEEASDTVQSTASIGKVFLLCEISEGIVDGRLDPAQRVTRDPAVAVADSGIWQYLWQDSLPLVDACVLVAAVSDNWATNVLIPVVGLDAVARRARALGCHHSGLHDRVRDVRADHEPPTLSTGTARELAEVARRIHVAARGGRVEGISADAARRVEEWLLAGVDLSMVAAPFGLDPLAHAHGRPRLWSKTGTDTFVRADMGVASSGNHALSYAAIATWEPRAFQSGRPDHRMDAYARMHALGTALASRLW